MRNAKKIALCGMLAALAVIALLLSSATGFGIYAGPLLAMMILLPVTEEFGAGTGLAAWAAVSVLGLVLVPDRELCLVFLLLGWYPVARRPICRLRSRFLVIVCKLLIYAAAVGLLYGVLMGVMGLDPGLAGNSKLFTAGLFVCGAAVFLLADRALDQAQNLWRHRLRNRLMR